MERNVQLLELEEGISERIERLREGHIYSVPYVSVERCLHLTNSFQKTEGEPKEIRRAKALMEIVENLSIDIDRDELLVGGITTKPRGAHLFPELSVEWLKDELDTLATREFDPLVVSEEDKEIVRKEVIPYWEGKTNEELFNSIIPESVKDILEAHHCSCRVRYFTLTQPSMFAPKEFLSLGFKGLKMKADHRIERLNLSKFEDVNKLPLLNSVKIACDAATTFIKRYAALAKELEAREENAGRKKELERIAEACEWISENPPRTFFEALQLSLFVLVTERLEASANTMQPGRVDQWLYPFYQKDIDEGRITREEALELIECFFIKVCNIWLARPKEIAAHYGGYANWFTINIGGLTREGQDATNELSYLLLQAQTDLKLYLPDISIRLHKGTPDDFLRKACEVLRLGMGHPKFYNDEQIIPIVMQVTNGTVTLEQARDYFNSACVEFQLAEDPCAPCSQFHWGGLNSAAPLEYVLTNGIARITGKKIGIETGDPRKFSSYDEVVEALKKQYAHTMSLYITLQNLGTFAALNSTVATPFMSAMHPVCIENGVDFYSGGGLPPELRFCFAHMGVGTPDVIDSLVAIKKLVFEDKVISMAELTDALDNDFKGREDLRQMLINNAPKYGNDDDYADSIAKEICCMEAEELYKYRNAWGGKWYGLIHSLTSNNPFGMVTGALPSGRKAWTALADAGAPYFGYDRNGPTAVIKSIGKINRAPLENGTAMTVLNNMRLSPVILEAEKGLDNMSAFLRAWVELDCFHIQFNVVSSETLRAAQAHPEKYPDLMVKVAGWSAYFTQINRSLQDDIIERTEHSVWP